MVNYLFYKAILMNTIMLSLGGLFFFSAGASTTVIIRRELFLLGKIEKLFPFYEFIEKKK